MTCDMQKNGYTVASKKFEKSVEQSKIKKIFAWKQNTSTIGEKKQINNSK